MLAAVRATGDSFGSRPSANRPSGAVGRVAAAQREARRSLVLAASFAVAAVVTAAVPHDTGSWLPMHLLLAGAMTMAVSGVAPLLAVGWSAGPPPPVPLALAQRSLLASGVAALALGRELDWPPAVMGAAGTAVISSLVLLGAALAFVGRDRVEHRFDAAYRSYFAALAASFVATGLGLTGVLGNAVPGWRDAHVALNLLGFLGLVIAGTLPFFVATQARAARPPRSSVAAQDVATAVLCIGVVLVTGGALSAGRLIGAAGFVLYAAGICLVIRQLRLPGWEKARWAGPRLVQTYVALCWWIGSVFAAAVRSLDGEPPLRGDVLIALGVGGYAQLLVASLAYLGPVLRGGGHERLAAGFATTRSWLGLAAVNLGVVLLLAGWTVPAAGAIGAWALDACWRGLRLVRR